MPKKYFEKDLIPLLVLSQKRIAIEAIYLDITKKFISAFILETIVKRCIQENSFEFVEQIDYWRKHYYLSADQIKGAIEHLHNLGFIKREACLVDNKKGYSIVLEKENLGEAIFATIKANYRKDQKAKTQKVQVRKVKPLRKEAIVLQQQAEEIFNFWNECRVVIHRQMNVSLRKSIKNALKKFNKEEILEAIKNYASVLHDEKTFWTCKWSLKDFLEKGLDRFSPENFDVTSYLKPEYKQLTEMVEWAIEEQQKEEEEVTLTLQ